MKTMIGDCRDILPTLAAGSVHCCVTSPPYYGLRDYGVAGQIGLEATPDAYVAEMVAVFREVRRVLRDDGTLWLNIGDSYASGGNGGGSGKQSTNVGAAMPPKRAPDGYKPKDLFGIPWQLAFALRADGWYLRSDVIWHKPNPMPESVTDRPTSAHEHVFLLSKSATYFYDADTIKEDGAIPAGTRAAKGSNQRGAIKNVNGRAPEYWNYTGSRNARNVWTITTKPYSGAHFATMPPDLAERCIKAGTSERGCCPKCGAPWSREVERQVMEVNRSGRYDSLGDRGRTATSGTMTKPPSSVTIGWFPTCDCGDATPVPCVVLDPFGGAGTTGLVADRLQRDAILIELNPEYAGLSKERLTADAPLFADVT